MMRSNAVDLSDDDEFEKVSIEDLVKHQILDPGGLALGAIIASSQKGQEGPHS